MQSGAQPQRAGGHLAGLAVLRKTHSRRQMPYSARRDRARSTDNTRRISSTAATEQRRNVRHFMAQQPIRQRLPALYAPPPLPVLNALLLHSPTQTPYLRLRISRLPVFQSHHQRAALGVIAVESTIGQLDQDPFRALDAWGVPFVNDLRQQELQTVGTIGQLQ